MCAGGVEVGGPHTEAQVDVVLGVPAGVVHERLLALILAQQVALGQWRALVRALDLLTDEHDAGR